MRKQMIENAAYEVATQVRAVEESIEAALIELAELQTRMVHARAARSISDQRAKRASLALAAVRTANSSALAGIPGLARNCAMNAGASR